MEVIAKLKLKQGYHFFGPPCTVVQSSDSREAWVRNLDLLKGRKLHPP